MSTRRICRYMDTRTRSEWAVLLLSYALAGYVLYGVAVYAQSDRTYQFGSGSRFGNGPRATRPEVEVDPVQRQLSEQADEIATMRAGAAVNIAKLEALDRLDLPAQLKTMRDFMDDSKRTWDRILDLGGKILAALVAGILLQAWHVRQARRPTQTDLKRAVLAAMRAKDEGEYDGDAE